MNTTGNSATAGGQGSVSFVVSYALLDALSAGLSNAGNNLAPDTQLPGLISGDADIDQATNFLEDSTRDLTATIQTTLGKTAQQTHQAADDYARADKAFSS
ncbi:hypothetical protein ABH924_005050 [Arthrobacter sp. GAS37]|uniref:hypothetical protein n=1 Tax=Arthrobacter sp. GAS37 TaxID=3156261 RepID=UPI003832CBD0